MNKKLLSYNSQNNNFFTIKKVVVLSLWSLLLIAIVIVSLKLIIKVDLQKLNEIKSAYHNWLLILIAFAIGYYLYSIFCRLITFWMKIHPIAPHINLWSWIEFSLISIFIQIITPFSIGSEPYAIWWLKQKRVSIKDSTVIVGLNLCLWSFSQVIITWPSFIWFTIKNASLISQKTISWPYWLILAGLLVDLGMMCFVFALNYSRHIHVLCSQIYNQSKKWLHFSSYLNKHQIVRKYKSYAFYKKEFKKQILQKNTLVILGINIAYALVSYCLFVLFYCNYTSGTNPNFMELFHIINITTTANNFSPSPSGEGSLQAILKDFLTGHANNDQGQINNTIFLWRFSIVYGVFIFSLTGIIGINFPKIIKKLLSRNANRLTHHE